jgi:hypothetical protein
MAQAMCQGKFVACGAELGFDTAGQRSNRKLPWSNSHWQDTGQLLWVKVVTGSNITWRLTKL